MTGETVDDQVKKKTVDMLKRVHEGTKDAPLIADGSPMGADMISQLEHSLQELD
eukprot:gene4208-4513_t